MLVIDDDRVAVYEERHTRRRPKQHDLTLHFRVFVLRIRLHLDMITDPIKGLLFVLGEHVRDGSLGRLAQISISLGRFVLPDSVLMGNEDQRVL